MKTALITGGSRGIGAACAALFAKNGYRVAVVYRNSTDKAKAVVSGLEGLGSLYRCDIGNSAEVAEMSRKVLDDFGHVDVLVNNAGISRTGLLHEMDDDSWNEILRCNLTGMFYVTRAFLPSMIHEKSGSIVNISSVWGISGASCEVAYSASKAGVIGFTKALAKEVGPSNIRVNCIAPGVIDTEMNSHLSPEDFDSLRDETPLCRIGTPAEVAEAVYSVAAAGFVTGQVIAVDGGFAV